MPSGKSHTQATVTTSILVLFLVKPIETALFVSLGCLIGIVVSPDLDVDVGHYGFRIIRMLFGDWVYKVWKLYWKPYAKIMKHRSVLSHFPILSTIIRFLYLFSPIFLILWSIHPQIQLNLWILWVFLGLCLVDAIHASMDGFSTFIKRSLR